VGFKDGKQFFRVGYLLTFQHRRRV
jgi:hypothetical protein